MQADGIETPFDILVCPFTTTRVDAPLYRLPINPSAANGLLAASQLMVDKVGPVSRNNIAKVVGRLSAEDLLRLEVALVTMLDLGV